MQVMQEAAVSPNSHPIEDLWPLFGLRLRTERLELRPPDDRAIAQLAAVAQRGVHDPEESPFASGWTDQAADEFGYRFAQYFWNQRAEWNSKDWALPFGVYLAGEPVGVQQITARDFPLLRTVGTGSWVARTHHGLGIGTEMRAVALSFAFDHLGAEFAITAAYTHATASMRVSHKLGYEANGVRRDVVRGRAVDARLFRINRETWQKQARPSITVDGIERCLHMFAPADSLPAAIESS
jgi:RimJ/RimL family protein N-acetyltransferase